MYQVIARKYRPQTFSELVGQGHVRTTLENAISQGRIAHGYIFSGQRGTGKTTVARILARCLNCVNGPTAQPCGVCSSCTETAAGNAVDVIEIDAASNRGINEMRELRENVRYRPARDRYKVFIVDEAHQITHEAFNALLKTLEEPPEWVVFILCTTEAHKIPTTIASRCQQFSFRSVDFEELIERMAWICAQEGVEADPETLAVLAQAGEGSVRDSLSALDQAIACCGSTLNADEVRTLLGMFSVDSLHQVTQALSGGTSQQMLEIVDDLERNGRHLQHFCRELARYFRSLLVVRVAGKGTRLVAATGGEQEKLADIAQSFSEEDLTRYLQLTLDLFRDLQFSLQPRLHLEIGLLKLLHAGKLAPIEEALAMLKEPGSSQSLPPTVAAPPRAQGSAAPAPPRVGPSPFAMDTRRKTQTAPPAEAAAVVAPPSPAAGGTLKSRLHAWLVEREMLVIADAVEHSEVVESSAEIVFRAPREFWLALRSGDMQQAVHAVLGRVLKVKVENGESAAEPLATKQNPAPQTTGQAGDASERALSHPDVQRFREAFPESQIRTIRNLKE